MITLHGIWTDGPAATFRIWGEDAALPRSGPKRRGRRPKKPPVLPHPFAAGHDTLAVALDGPAAGEPGSATILLPAAGQDPFPSPECEPGSVVPEQAGCAPYLVPTVSLHGSAAIAFLAGLPTGAGHGATLRFWAEAARFALGLVARQSFVPGARGWEALLRGEEHDHAARLAASLPPACRFWAAGEEAALPDPEKLVTAFLNHAIHTIVTGALAEQPLLPKPRGRPRKTVPPAEQWVEMLSGRRKELTGTEEVLTRFSRELEDWLSPAAAPLRACFRLDEPEGNGKRWRLSFHLQAVDDPGIVIPAADVWNRRGEACTSLAQRFEDPQDRLLIDLGRASRIYPALQASLASRRPAAVSLSTGEAHAFLSEWAPLLIENGFGVILPTWWKETASRPALRLKVKPAREGGQLGLDALVSFDWTVALGDRVLSSEEFEDLANLKVPLVRMHSRWMSVDGGGIERALTAFRKKFASGTMTAADLLGIAAGADPDMPAVSEVAAEGWLRGFLDGVTIEPVPQPAAFAGTLRPYQQRGLAWLSFLTQNECGACLADDMGLGKTVQVIAYLLAERERGCPAAPTLLVCPMSIVGNWRREFARFAPDLAVAVHHGSGRAAGDAFAGEAAAADVVITTYPLAVRDEESLASVAWGCIVLDEAQNIKNPATKQARAVRAIGAPRRIALTGTPVENRLTELWSIMEFLNPGYLGPFASFQSGFAVPVERYRDPARTARLRELIRPFVLRRMKTDRSIISDLPEKMEMKVICSLSAEQATLYEAVVQEMLERAESAEGIQRRGIVLGGLTRLKQICDHPALFLHDRSAFGERSGKIARLEEMLEEVLDAGERALIFTQFAELGTLLEGYLRERFGTAVLYLHGKTAQKERDAMVQRFQQPGGPHIFILSLKAGGTGLNLTAANHVFHLDRWWNPAVENQATDRAFRIGQTRDVQVRLMIAAGTLEERIDTLIEEKKALADQVIGTGEDWVSSLSTDQLRDLLTLRRDAVED
ncbi:DEAD/DEAH box helicase [Methanoculleus sp. FWC-SCC1]|uniref:DEAD/DEAH box helicase n=1 Tax=Methanoculleus frigidifontis TaxID=2584085 RepID=A0ABT8MBX5_9EURY|nr:DEAD/DEAH box helicase [Methanoculleus sp. FWC-SCC1]MDN7025438.1 DEAD/DEAH box helicase [Methanoculleus sp. FWC-SCC1]